MPFNQISILSTLKKKPRLNILIFYGDIKGDTGLLGHIVYKTHD
jgi:hypothetical protein